MRSVTVLSGALLGAFGAQVNAGNEEVANVERLIHHTSIAMRWDKTRSVRRRSAV